MPSSEWVGGLVGVASSLDAKKGQYLGVRLPITVISLLVDVLLIILLVLYEIHTDARIFKYIACI